MSTTQEVKSVKDAQLEVIFPLGDLYSDEPQLENDLHLRQIILLIQCLEWLWRDRQDFFASGNLSIFYSPEQRNRKIFAADFFVVLGTERRSRKSWVVWQEGGKYPNVIVEILSESTAKVDRGEKKQIYQDIFRLPDYFWFDPESLEFAGFTLISGTYQPIEPTEQGWMWSEQLNLYLGIHQQQLRFFTPEGELVPTPEESAILEKRQREFTQQQLDTERQQRELVQQELEQLKAQLRALGVEPEQ